MTVLQNLMSTVILLWHLSFPTLIPYTGIQRRHASFKGWKVKKKIFGTKQFSHRFVPPVLAVNSSLCFFWHRWLIFQENDLTDFGSLDWWAPSVPVLPKLDDPAIQTLVDHFKLVITHIADDTWRHFKKTWTASATNKTIHVAGLDQLQETMILDTQPEPFFLGYHRLGQKLYNLRMKVVESFKNFNYARITPILREIFHNEDLVCFKLWNFRAFSSS